MSESKDKNDAEETESEELAHVDDAVIGRALRGSLIVFAGLAVVVVGALVWLNRPAPTPEVVDTPLVAARTREAPTVEPPTVGFTDITEEAGIEFVHENGATGRKLLPETMGSGCAFLDFDNDGAQDLLLLNATHWPDSGQGEDPAPTMALYANDGTGAFEDVTARSGMAASFYGQGVAIGDYDNDGWIDVYVSAVGSNHLFHNRQGKFVDVTEGAGVAGRADAWSTSCSFVDFDNDGDLDLFVGNYVRWSPEFDLAQGFTLDGKERAYGPPTAFEGSFPYLFRNDGGGRFTDISTEAGIEVTNAATDEPMAKSLGVAPADLDGDGWIDLIVANDTVQNFLFRNRKDGTFEEIGAMAGVAYDAAGNARGAMGIDTARFRNDPTLGIGIGNFANEMSALYVSDGSSTVFQDCALSTGLGPPTRLLLTFGLFFFDYDLDGRLDLFAANGHLETDINLIQPSQHYEQPPQLFWNCGPESPTEFVTVPAEKCGSDLVRPMVGRGAAYADIDADGDLDIVITSTGGAPRLLRNDLDLGHHYLRFELEGTRSNRDAIGAVVEVTIGDRVLSQQVMPTRSYLSQVELPVTFGLGPETEVDTVHVRWPDGSEQMLKEVVTDRTTKLRQPE